MRTPIGPVTVLPLLGLNLPLFEAARLRVERYRFVVSEAYLHLDRFDAMVREVGEHNLDRVQDHRPDVKLASLLSCQFSGMALLPRDQLTFVCASAASNYFAVSFPFVDEVEEPYRLRIRYADATPDEAFEIYTAQEFELACALSRARAEYETDVFVTWEFPKVEEDDEATPG